MSIIRDLFENLISQVEKLTSKGILPEGDIEGLEKAAGEADLFLHPREEGADCLYNHVHFNKLTSREAEALAILAEECGEVVQAVGKILRHGFESRHPYDDGGMTNRQHLRKEVVDVLAAAQMLSIAGPDLDITREEILETVQRKLHYTHHQKD